MHGTSYLFLSGAVVALGLASGGCSRRQEPARAASSQQAPSTSAASAGRDPCALVSQAEMETLLGHLAEAPYRVAHRRPDPAGDACMYRAHDLRNVTLFVAWKDGDRYFRLFQGLGGAVENRLGGRDAAGDSIAGPWDRVATPFGQFIVLRGSVAIHVDALGSRLDLPDREQIARFAIGRLDAPLSYDGAAAARHVPASSARRNPCTLITRAEVESVMGPLQAEPKASEDGDECRFALTQTMMGRPVERALQVQWTDGFYALGQEGEASGRARKAMQQAMGAAPAGMSTAAGTPADPWDEQATLAGGVVAVVKHDVLLKIPADGMYGFTRERAVQLLRIAAGRL
jgi:hypothetical protein